MKKQTIKYIHDEFHHNFVAPEEMVPILMNLLSPKSVVDVGCGIGNWLKVFLDKGITDILGIDGSYVNKDLLKINTDFFIEFDLEQLFRTNKKFDLVLSLEVAEHLKEESSSVFVESLTNLGDVVVFSAARPNQGGQNHLNEQEPLYWIEHFEKLGFECFDVLRPMIWNNSNIDSWYKQNILVFSKDAEVNNKLKDLNNFLGFHLVHPELFDSRSDYLNNFKSEYDNIIDGKKGLKFYISLLLRSLRN